MTNERIAQLIEFATGLVAANKAGVYELPLIATPEETLEVLTELAAHRKEIDDKINEAVGIKTE